jgi:hypothetical protein
MTSRQKNPSVHRHVVVERRALAQRHGVPYQVVRCVCARCQQVLDERPVRRLAA